jgi:hypothetical protein
MARYACAPADLQPIMPTSWPGGGQGLTNGIDFPLANVIGMTYN